MSNDLLLNLRMLGLSGLLHAIKGYATNTAILHEIKRHDCAFPFWVRTPSSDVPTYRKVFIEDEYDFATETPPEVIVDAGANIGLASIYFANTYREAKIIAIEPEQSNFELLKKNSAPYANIVPLQAALWHKDEEINIIDPGLGKWGFMAEGRKAPACLPRHICHSVKGITMNRVMDQFRLEKIDILKIDIEGSEKEVFQNTSSWIDRVGGLIIELHERMKPGCLRSFYNGSNGFDLEWRQGENVYLSRGRCLTRR